MVEDISSERGAGWVRLYCDAPCDETVEYRPVLGGELPEGWTQDTRQTPLTTSGIKHYCPTHAGLATA